MVHAYTIPVNEWEPCEVLFPANGLDDAANSNQTVLVPMKGTGIVWERVITSYSGEGPHYAQTTSDPPRIHLQSNNLMYTLPSGAAPRKFPRQFIITDVHTVSVGNYQSSIVVTVWTRTTTDPNNLGEISISITQHAPYDILDRGPLLFTFNVPVGLPVDADGNFTHVVKWRIGANDDISFGPMYAGTRLPHNLDPLTTAANPSVAESILFDDGSTWNRSPASVSEHMTINTTERRMIVTGATNVSWYLTSAASRTMPCRFILPLLSAVAQTITVVYHRLGSEADLAVNYIVTQDVEQIAVFDFNGGTSPVTEVVGFTIEFGGPAVTSLAGAEPHVVCLDGTRMEVYHDGDYRLFETQTETEKEKDGVVAVAANIRVRNTFIDSATVFTGSIPRYFVQFETATPNDLHARAVSLKYLGVDGKSVEGHPLDTREVATDENGVFVAVDMGAGHTLRAETRYRSVVVTNPAWRKGAQLTAGGVMSGVVHTIASEGADADVPKDAGAPGPMRTFTLGQWDAHALVCDAHFPHIVTFQGDSFIPGGGPCVLFADSTLRVHGTFDDFSRVQKLVVERAKGDSVGGWEMQMGAVWVRERERAPSANALADLEFRLSADGETTVVPTTVVLSTRGDDRTEQQHEVAKRCTNFTSKEFETESGAYLLVRVQANGSASFAIRGSAGAAIGALVGTGDSVVQDDTSTSIARWVPESTARASAYELVVEPHLARARGASVARGITHGAASCM